MNQNFRNLKAKADAHISSMMGDVAAKRDEYVGNRVSGMAGAGHTGEKKMITIDITNTDEENDLLVPIFSASENIAVPFNLVPDFNGVVPQAGKGVTIVAKNYSASELKDLARTNPFTIGAVRYTFGDNAQLANDWTVRRKDGSELYTKTYEPAQDLGFEQQVQTALMTKNFFAEINAGTTLFVKISKAISSTSPRKVQLMIFVDAQLDITSALRNQSVVNINAPA